MLSAARRRNTDSQWLQQEAFISLTEQTLQRWAVAEPGSFLQLQGSELATLQFPWPSPVVRHTTNHHILKGVQGRKLGTRKGREFLFVSFPLIREEKNLPFMCSFVLFSWLSSFEKSPQAKKWRCWQLEIRLSIVHWCGKGKEYGHGTNLLLLLSNRHWKSYAFKNKLLISTPKPALPTSSPSQ